MVNGLISPIRKDLTPHITLAPGTATAQYGETHHRGQTLNENLSRRMLPAERERLGGSGAVSH